MTESTRTTGNDPLSGVDPGGTRPTKPGNPDKSGGAQPGEVSKDQTIKTGNQNDFTKGEER